MGIAVLTLSVIQTSRRKLKQLMARKPKADNFFSPLGKSAEPSPKHCEETMPGSAEATRVLASSLISHCVPVSHTQGKTPIFAQHSGHEKWAFTLPATRLLPGYWVAPMTLPVDAASAAPARLFPVSTCLNPTAATPLGKASVKNIKRVSSTRNGRLVVAGRMADVCAELDRLVACEALGCAA